MIYTVTLNPSLDYIVDVDKFNIGEINRARNEMLFAGGKGINVSTVLTNMGVENTALGFTAGFTGDEIERKLSVLGVRTDFIKIQNGMSRINLTVRNAGETAVSGMGPDVSEEDINKLRDKISMISDNDMLILSGSLPKCISQTIYGDIMSWVSHLGIDVVVDATKDVLLNSLKYHPLLIKPNHHELGEIFGTEINEQIQVIEYAHRLQSMGARNVLVSMAEKGAVLVAEDNNIYSTESPKGTLVNSVGAGDSMVAGFVAEWTKSKNYEEAFYMGVAAGSASAFSNGLATLEEIICVRKQII